MITLSTGFTCRGADNCSSVYFSKTLCFPSFGNGTVKNGKLSNENNDLTCDESQIGHRFKLFI